MNYDYYTTGTYGSGAALAGTVIFTTIISIAAAVFGIIIMWKIFKKAGKEGWIAIIPLYNTYTLFEITWGNGWYFLLLFLSILPIIGWIASLVIVIITMVKLAKAFGKSGGFAAGLIFLSVIFLAILAFDKSTYLGPQTKSGAAQPAPVPPQSNGMTNQPVNEQPTQFTYDNQTESTPVEPTVAEPQTTSVCANCGAALPEGTMFCPNCGSPKTS